MNSKSIEAQSRAPDAASTAPVSRRATDAEVAEWAERHDIANRLKDGARDAFEDAESLHQTYAAPLAQQVARQTLQPMQSEDDQEAGIVRQWYFNCDGHYIDVACDDGKYSVYFRDRYTGKEAWIDQSDKPVVANSNYVATPGKLTDEQIIAEFWKQAEGDWEPQEVPDMSKRFGYFFTYGKLVAAVRAIECALKEQYTLAPSAVDVRDAALEEAANTCLSKRIERTVGDLNERELAHNFAVGRCCDAIRALQGKPLALDVAPQAERAAMLNGFEGMFVDSALAAAPSPAVAQEGEKDEKRLRWIHHNMSGTTIRGTIVNVLADRLTYADFVNAIDAQLDADKQDSAHKIECPKCGLDRLTSPCGNPSDCGMIGQAQQDSAQVAAPDLIAMIVDRDTPPDNRDEVVDHDIAGNPITRGIVAAFSQKGGA